MPIEFTAESRQRIESSLQSYFREHFDEDLGVLRTGRLFEFIAKLVGAAAYNQAVVDAQAYLHGKLLDMEGDLQQDVEYG